MKLPASEKFTKMPLRVVSLGIAGAEAADYYVKDNNITHGMVGAGSLAIFMHVLLAVLEQTDVFDMAQFALAAIIFEGLASVVIPTAIVHYLCKFLFKSKFFNFSAQNHKLFVSVVGIFVLLSISPAVDKAVNELMGTVMGSL